MHRNEEKKSCCRFTDKVRKCFAGKRCQAEVTPLSLKGRPGRIKVCKITGDRRICARMASMGVYPGVEADVVCSGGGNRCILKLDGGTISLDAEVTANILVSQL